MDSGARLTHPSTPEELINLISYYAQEFGLGSWTIKMELGPMSNGHDTLAETRVDKRYKTARITFADDIFKEDTRQSDTGAVSSIVRVVIHELLHIVEADSGASDLEEMAITFIKPYLPAGPLEAWSNHLQEAEHRFLYRVAALLEPKDGD